MVDHGTCFLDLAGEPFPVVDGAAFLQDELFVGAFKSVSDHLGMGVKLASLHGRLDNKGRTVHCVLLTITCALCFVEGLSHSPRVFCLIASLPSFLTIKIDRQVVLLFGNVHCFAHLAAMHSEFFRHLLIILLHQPFRAL